MCSVKRAISSADPFSGAAHVNTPIFLVSVLFCVSTFVGFLATSVCTIITWYYVQAPIAGAALGLGASQYTCPLAAAALFPLILILRKRELKHQLSEAARDLLGGVRNCCFKLLKPDYQRVE